MCVMGSVLWHTKLCLREESGFSCRVTATQRIYLYTLRPLSVVLLYADLCRPEQNNTQEYFVLLCGLMEASTAAYTAQYYYRCGKEKNIDQPVGILNCNSFSMCTF